MFIGAILVCATMQNAASCEVKLNTSTLYNTQQECVDDMMQVTKYVVESLKLKARPYCFPIGATSV